MFVRVLLFVSLVAGGSEVVAQRPPRTIDAVDVDCGRCRIQLEIETTIRPPHDSSFGSTGTMVRTEGGQLFVVHDELMTRVLGFDVQGRSLLGIGREGDGPGEFRRATILGLAPHNGLRVWDPVNRRMSMFDLQGRFQGSHPFQGRIFDFLPLANGRYLVAGEVATEAQIGLPLHLVDSGLSVVRSFGSSDRGRVSPTEAFSAQRLFTFRPRDGRVWLSRRDSYVLEEWDTLGVMRRRIVRAVDWFLPYTQIVPFTDTRPPQPQVVALQAGRGDLLWVVVRVADSTWAKAVVPFTAEYLREPSYRTTSDEGMFDSMIEVYSTTTGNLLATTRVPWYVTGFVDAERMLAVRETSDGGRYFEVVRMQLTR